MMSKRLEFLIREIRSQSFSVNSTFSDDVLSLYLNEAQNSIRKVIFLSNNESNVLKSTKQILITNGQKKYQLPERMFAENSIVTVIGKYSTLGDDDIDRSLSPVSIRNYNKLYGYTLMNTEIWLSSISQYSDLAAVDVIYTGDLPALSKRSGNIDSILGNVLTLSDYDVELDLKSDYVTIVDKNGQQIATDREIVSFNSTTGELTLDSVIDVVAGQYVLVGGFSTNRSILPDLCEDYLKKYVERRIAKEDSSQNDYVTSDYFTKREREDIASIFAESSEDIRLPEFSQNSILI